MQKIIPLYTLILLSEAVLLSFVADGTRPGQRMGKTCAVASCDLWYGNKSKTKKAGTSYFTFPKDKQLAGIWVSRCKRAESFNTSTSYICSEHFSTEDYCPSYLSKVKLMPEVNHLPLLKGDAVPSMKLPSNYSW